MKDSNNHGSWLEPHMKSVVGLGAFASVFPRDDHRVIRTRHVQLVHCRVELFHIAGLKVEVENQVPFRELQVKRM